MTTGILAFIFVVLIILGFIFGIIFLFYHSSKNETGRKTKNAGKIKISQPPLEPDRGAIPFIKSLINEINLKALRSIVKLVQPYEVKVSKKFVKSFLDNHNGPGRSLVEDLANELLSNTETTVLMIRAEKVPASSYAAQCILKASDALLTSGNLHIYRGVLSAPGRHIKAIWNAALDYCIETGIEDAQEEKRYREFIENEIASIG
ncbi:hypothetical protein [Brachymonas wangyanguii]|uniref:hypothetical protein n=1 Tax=Brachymonas wangyanguii TaxID=3130163 RepID=UPI00307D07DB